MADQARAVSSSLSRLAVELKDKTSSHQVQARQMVDRNLETKIDKTEQLRSMLEQALKAVNTEMEAVSKVQQELEAFLADQEAALAWSSQQQDTRATERPVRERTDDTTQYSFAKMSNVVSMNINNVKKLILGCRADTIKLVEVRRKLEKDMQEKSYALGLDTEAVQASEDRAPTPFYVPPSTVGVPMTMGSWVKATEENCLLADRCIQNGERMRHLSNIKMQEHKAAEHKAVKAALLELRNNKAATEKLSKELQKCISETEEKIKAGEGTHSELQEALTAKYPSMDLTKHRFTHRVYGTPADNRPEKELMGDFVHQSLRDEYTYLDKASQQLYDRISQVQTDISFLESASTQLKDDLTDKQLHLSIDKKVEESAMSKYPAL